MTKPESPQKSHEVNADVSIVPRAEDVPNPLTAPDLEEVPIPLAGPNLEEFWVQIPCGLIDIWNRKKRYVRSLCVLAGELRACSYEVSWLG